MKTQHGISVELTRQLSSDAATAIARWIGLYTVIKNEIYVSAANAWEISIKVALGALNAPVDIDQVIEDKGFLKLPITVFHGQQAGSLPAIYQENSTREHKDPFDRMLIGQAQAEGLYLMTRDPVFTQYAVRILNAEA